MKIPTSDPHQHNFSIDPNSDSNNFAIDIFLGSTVPILGFLLLVLLL